MPTKKDKTKRNALPYQLRIRCEHRELDEGALISNGGASTSNTQRTRSKNSKSQNWRAQIRAKHPAKYKELQTDAVSYSRLYRLKCATAETSLNKRNVSPREKKEAEKWHNRKLRNNETARNRMNKMNRRKKAEEESGNKRPKKVLTRHQSDKKKEKQNEYKRKQRAGLSEERKEAELARRRELYAIKNQTQRETVLKEQQKKLNEEEDRFKKLQEEVKAKEAEREERLRALEEQLRNKEIALSEQAAQIEAVNNGLPEDDALDLRSELAKRKALQRVKASLPKRRSHSVTTTVDLINKSSPRKSAALKKAGISPNRLHEGVMEAVANCLAAPRKSTKRKHMATALSAIKKHNLQRATARHFKCSRELLRKAKKKTAGRRAISMETIKCIRSFYEATSNPLPDKKLVSKKTNKPRHILDSTIAELYEQYKKAHPEHPVSATMFYMHRPIHVKCKSEAKYNGCLCEYCENISLKLQAVNKLKQGLFKNDYQFISQTMCAKPEGWRFHRAKCIQRNCDVCGTHKLDDKLGDILAQPNKMVVWQRWELVTTEYHGKKGTQQIKKRKPILKEDSVAQLVKELKEEAEPFAEHLFNKDWQNSQEKSLIQNLSSNEVLGIYDFAENYKCGHQREVQSAYYAQDSATIHPIVLYYSCPSCEEQVRESVVMVSDDLVHDYNAVSHFHKCVSEHLERNRSLKISTFYRFSDGASSQYKSKGPISDISYGKDDFNHIIHHNYSGTRHGKGASDGESGVVKRQASDAVKSGKAVISTPEAMYIFLRDNVSIQAESDTCCKPFRRTVLFVKSADIDRERQQRVVRTVQGTRKLHSIKTMEGGKVGTRNLSCFCESCRRGNDQCKNSRYVRPWKEVNLHNTRQDATLQSTTNHKENDPAEEGYQVEADQEDQARDDDELVEEVDQTRDGKATTVEKVMEKRIIPVDMVEGMHVAVMVPHVKQKKNFVYIASISQKTDNAVIVKFMERLGNSGSTFVWPSGAKGERLYTHPLADVICSLQPPTFKMNGRSLLYVFSSQDMDNISKSVSVGITIK